MEEVEKVNLITVFYLCGGADGVDIFLNNEYLTSLQNAYDVVDLLADLFHKIDMSKNVCIRQLDIDEYLDSDAADWFFTVTDEDPDQYHNQFTLNEMIALYNADYDYFARLFNDRCKGGSF